jgi:hypothetical protein
MSNKKHRGLPRFKVQRSVAVLALVAVGVGACQSILGIKDDVAVLVPAVSDAAASETGDIGPSTSRFCDRPENVGSISNSVVLCEDFDHGFSDFSTFTNAGDAGALQLDTGRDGKGLVISAKMQKNLATFFARRVPALANRALVEAEFDILLERFEDLQAIGFLNFIVKGSLGAPIEYRVGLAQSDALGTQLFYEFGPTATGAVKIGQSGTPASLLRLKQWARMRLTLDVRSAQTRVAVLHNGSFVLPTKATPSEVEARLPTESEGSSIPIPPLLDAGPFDASVSDADAAPPALSIESVTCQIGAQTGALGDLSMRLDNIVLRSKQ